MKNLCILGRLTTLVSIGGVAFAADGDRNPNRFNLRGGTSFNIKTEFTSTSPAPPIGPAPAFGAAGNANRFYDDGYVRIDGSGNTGGQTWFWGYQSATQYTPAGGLPGAAGSTMAFHSASSPADGVVRRGKDEADPSFELSYNRDLGGFSMGANRRAYWGIEGAFAYTHVSRRDAGLIAGTVLQTTDTYTLPAGSIPFAPAIQNGITSAGPGPLLNVSGPTPADIFTRSAPTPAAAAANVLNQLTADMYAFKLGPYLELPLHERVSLSLGGGMLAAVVAQEYSFNHQVAVTGGATTAQTGAGSGTGWVYGGMAYARLGWRFLDNWSLNGGVEYVAAGRTSLNASGKTSTVDFGQVWVTTLGLSYSF